jgi:hypothetical protein
MPEPLQWLTEPMSCLLPILTVGSEGIWAIPLHGGEPSLLVQNAELQAPVWFSVGPDQLYVTVHEHESDIWVMDVEVER